MEIVTFFVGALGFIFGITAYIRIGNLEKKLKEFDVIPRDFDSENNLKESE